MLQQDINVLEDLATFVFSVKMGQSPWHGVSSGSCWRRLSPDNMEGGCKYSEQAVMDSRQWVVPLFGGGGANNSSL